MKAFHYENLKSLKAYVLAFVTAYLLRRAKDPSPLKINRHHLIPGPKTSRAFRVGVPESAFRPFGRNCSRYSSTNASPARAATKIGSTVLRPLFVGAPKRRCVSGSR